MTYTTKILCLLLLAFTLACQSGNSDSNFPEGCIEQGVEFSGNNLMLTKTSESNQSLFLFHNKSNKSFWLNHPVSKDPGASAGWASEIESGLWSALAISGDINNFVITCSEIGDGEVKYLDCKNVIKSCQIQKAKFKATDSGSYWVIENKALNSVLEGFKSWGISW